MARRLGSGVRRWPLRVYAGLVLAFLYVPILVMVAFSFNASSRLSPPIESVSLKWYRAVLSDPLYTEAFRNSAIVAVVSAVSCLVIGSMAAVGAASARGKKRSTMNVLFFLPVTLPGLFAGLALLTFFSRLDVRPSLTTVAIAQFISALPYFLLIAQAGVDRLDPQFGEIGADLGAGGVQCFRRILAPIMWPVFVAAGVFAFAVSFEEFVRTFFVIGPQNTVPIVLWSQFRHGIGPAVNAIAVLLMGITVAGVFLTAIVIGARAHVRRTMLRSSE